MEMVYDLVKLFQKPYGVVLNKCLEDGQNPSEDFCREKGVPIIGKIPFDSKLGQLNSNGNIAARDSQSFSGLFASLLEAVQKEAVQ